VPHKLFRMQKAGQAPRGAARPVMLAIAGDSAAGKTTITRGLVEALGADRCTAVCVDDYHRYDRAERRDQPFTALHPDCNYLQIMEQHLQLLAMGQPVLKPVYDHHTGQLRRPVLVEPAEFVIIEGLLPLHTKLARACFDATVYLDPPEEIRRSWKVKRDTAERGYTADAVLAELDQRESESAAFIRPQRPFADIVIRFAPLPGRVVPAGTPLSAELLLRPTIRHPDLDGVVAQDVRDNGARPAIHLKLARDADGRPVDALHVHGDAVEADSEVVEKAIWSRLGAGSDPPTCLGRISDGQRNAPLAITQLLLLYHLLDAARLSGLRARLRARLRVRVRVRVRLRLWLRGWLRVGLGDRGPVEDLPGDRRHDDRDREADPVRRGDAESRRDHAAEQGPHAVPAGRDEQAGAADPAEHRLARRAEDDLARVDDERHRVQQRDAPVPVRIAVASTAIAATRVQSISTIRRRRSTRSTRTPPGRANSSHGSQATPVAPDTISGLDVREATYSGAAIVASPLLVCGSGR
jgi:phosphoribulokinase